MKNSHKLLSLIFAAFVLCSCEETIYPELESADAQIVIDAWVNNSPTPQYIRISETLPYFDSVSSSGLSNAVVYIIDNEENTRYVLKWETLNSNRDRPRPKPWPGPSRLILYKLKKAKRE